MKQAAKILKNKYIYKWEAEEQENAEEAVGVRKVFLGDSLAEVMNIVDVLQGRVDTALKAEF